MYTAVVLGGNGAEELVKGVEEILGETLAELDFPEVIAHHMTIGMGAFEKAGKYCPEHRLGDLIQLGATHVMHDEKVLAVKVWTDCGSQNEVKHVTVAVNRNKGGKPFHSNKLDWSKAIPFEEPIMLFGHIMECE
jgi:hypothetical protein